MKLCRFDFARALGNAARRKLKMVYYVRPPESLDELTIAGAKNQFQGGEGWGHFLISCSADTLRRLNFRIPLRRDSPFTFQWTFLWRMSGIVRKIFSDSLWRYAVPRFSSHPTTDISGSFFTHRRKIFFDFVNLLAALFRDKPEKGFQRFADANRTKKHRQSRL